MTPAGRELMDALRVALLFGGIVVLNAAIAALLLGWLHSLGALETVPVPELDALIPALGAPRGRPADELWDLRD